MSKTRRTTAARAARAAARAAIKAANAARLGEIDALEADAVNRVADDMMRALHRKHGVRYGNHRKMKAKEKVQRRKTARRSLNQIEQE